MNAIRAAGNNYLANKHVYQRLKILARITFVLCAPANLFGHGDPRELTFYGAGACS